MKASRPWFYGLLFTISLIVCGYFMFRQMPATQLFPNSDKWAHAVAFFSLVLLGYRATSRIGISFLLLLIGLLALAVGSEWVQGTAWLPLRSSDVGDLIANLSGCGLGLLAVMGWEWRRRWVLR